MKSIKYILTGLLIVSMLICYGCSKDNNSTTKKTEGQTIIIEKTDENGKKVTDKDGNIVTETSIFVPADSKDIQTFDYDNTATSVSGGNSGTTKQGETTKKGSAPTTTAPTSELPTKNNTTPIIWFDETTTTTTEKSTEVVH